MSRYYKIVFFGLLLLSTFSSTAILAHDNARVGVVDVQRVIAESVAWQKEISRLEQELSHKRKSISEQESALQQEINSYQQERSLLSTDQQTVRDQELNTKIATLQNQVSQQEQALNERSQRANQTIRLQAAQVIEAIASEKQLDIIFEVSEENFSVVFFTARLDISPETIVRLNDTYREIPLN